MPVEVSETRREYLRQYQRKWMTARRAEWFADKFCVDCGSKEKLELDHVDRKLKVTHNVWSWAKIRREEELAKCVTRCKICHAKRSGEQAKEYLSKPIIHGTVTAYKDRGCRCENCKIIYREYRRLKYLRRGT